MIITKKKLVNDEWFVEVKHHCMQRPSTQLFQRQKK